MQPKFKITANDTDLSDLLTGRLLSLSITDEIGLVSDTITLELDNRNDALEMPPIGAILEVFLGYDELYPMGKFYASEIEIKSPPATMIITGRADNPIADNFKSPRSYSWEKSTLSYIIKTIARRYELTPNISTEYQNIFVNHYDQSDESDSAFIQRLAGDYNANVKVANGNLLFIRPLSGKFPDGTPLPAIAIKESEIISYQMRQMGRDIYSAVIAKYYDFNAASEKQIKVGTGSPSFTLRDVFTNADAAKMRALERMFQIKIGEKTLTLELIGNPLLSAESVIEIPNINSEIRGEWIVKSAGHNLTTGGYKTNITAVKG